MEDAYVIGIRLALDNGVSAGIAAIAGDLGRLDAALAATQANLQRLQAMAVGMEMPRLPAPRTEAPTPAPAAAEPGQASVPDRAAPSRTDAAPMVSALAAKDEPAAPSVPPVVRILAQTSAAPVPMAEASLQPAGEAVAPMRNAPTVPAPKVTVVAPPAAAPVAAPMVAERTAPSTSSLPTASPEVVISPVRAAPERPGVSVSVAQDRQPSAPVPSVAPAAAAPVAAAYPATPMAPPPREMGSGPTGGDVFLDGMRMGRWVSDRLARDAGRPPSGVTGFDPRLGPAWPGPMQGE